MIRKVLKAFFIGLILLITSVYIYFNPEQPKSTIGNFITTVDLFSYCGLQNKKACNFPMPCEGEKINIIGYTKWDEMELRGLHGKGNAQTLLPIFFYNSKAIQNQKEYMILKTKFPRTETTIIEDEKTDDSSISAKKIIEKLTTIDIDKNELIIIKIKDAKIIGYDRPTNSNCTRGVGLMASYKNISFEKIK